MPMSYSELADYIWDCREVDIPHSPNLEHERGKEDGLPNYGAQLDGHVRVTICKKCHPRIPGHLVDIIPDNMERYFEIQDTTELMDALPRGVSGTGASKKIREKLMERCVRGRFNPVRGHAGRSFRVSLGYQWDRSEWQPDESVVLENDFVEKYAEAYTDEY